MWLCGFFPGQVKMRELGILVSQRRDSTHVEDEDASKVSAEFVFLSIFEKKAWDSGFGSLADK